MTDHELDQHLRRTFRAVAATVEAGAGGWEPIRVLVVDDQELFRRGLVMLLGLEPGIEVVGEARDGVEGTNLAASGAPDVVLLDVRMPKRSGIEACLAIKDVIPSAEIIMLTVSDEEADLYEAVKSGASGYLLKDSSIEEVAQAVRVVADGQSLISPSMAVKLIDEFKQMTRPGREQVPGGLRLTGRELEVLRLVAKGLNNRKIAKQLYISENTVKNHVRNILEKLQLHSRMEAVMYAVRENLLDPP
jgi:DNA-binding NarL/FixJ family response regulator